MSLLREPCKKRPPRATVINTAVGIVSTPTSAITATHTTIATTTTATATTTTRSGSESPKRVKIAQCCTQAYRNSST